MVRIAFALIVALVAPAVRADEGKVTTATRMSQAAVKFIASLTDAQKAKAVLPFADPERINWHYVPLQDASKKSTRRGVPLEDMTPEQKALALELLRSGTSASGFAKANAIMQFEALLAEQEKGGPNVRKPGWYFVTVFGTPGAGSWGWRWEGHHLALNYAIENGTVVGASPAFFGCNPARVQSGAEAGKRTLADEEDLAKQLFESLDAGQKQTALQGEHFAEIEGRTPRAKGIGMRGLAGAKMSPAQQETLLKLVGAYANRLPADVARAELVAAELAGVGNIHFAFSGATGPKEKHTYRVEGPTFQIQYQCTQDDSVATPANHIHSVYRSLKRDFGIVADGAKK